MNVGAKLPTLAFPATNGDTVDLASLQGISVVYVYPRTSPPDAPPIAGWDLIPGARGCTLQSCDFRDHHAELLSAGATHVFGLSAQSTEYQTEAVERLHLPFPLLSDEELELASQLGMPTFRAGGMVLFERTTLLIRDGVVFHVMYPIAEPERNATDVLALLSNQKLGSGSIL